MIALPVSLLAIAGLAISIGLIATAILLLPWTSLAVFSHLAV
jgi:hypothetical protein